MKGSMTLRRLGCLGLALLALYAAYPAASETVSLSKEQFLDQCRGAWAGQMFGVCFGAPTEFTSNGKPITGDLPVWKPENIAGAIGQDDCYVEMTFLKAIEDCGLDVTYEEAGKAFAATEYPLWHANRAGRDNVRAGIMPPKSGNPEFNRHADDIDFQIEADLFGILCPGLPLESNALCDIFGHVMNYGDGLYGGVFVAGMYAAAYFERNDVRAVINAGLACIPKESLYFQCIADVIRWHDQYPQDWLASWKEIEKRWQDDVDCGPGEAFNIDAKLNGAYIVMGLLYGEGDMFKTVEIATRCGQDSDCNPSNAAGVLGCMKGFKALDASITSGIPAIANEKFIYTNYSFTTLIEACQRVTESIIAKAGGKVEADAYAIPVQAPAQIGPLEAWTNQEAVLKAVILPSEIERWGQGWRLKSCGHDMEPGLRGEEFGQKNVLVIHPVSQDEPGVLEADLDVPANATQLVLPVASDTRGDFLLRVALDGKIAKEQVIDTKGTWTTVDVDIAAWAGKKLNVRIEDVADEWSFEAAYLQPITIK